ncbi:MAG: hypothetical protein ACRCZE_03090 [Candidatus Altimarinota bacterium]
MKNFEQLQTGVGIEMEGFIVGMENGLARELIDDQPASEWVMGQMRQRNPGIAEQVSMEQTSVMLEVKSNVQPGEIIALDEILEIRAAVNKILAEVDCSLKFLPVMQNKFDLVPASINPESRSKQLFDKWSGTPDGRNLLYSASIAGLQINDSRPFAKLKTDQEKLERARRIHNLMSKDFERLNGVNKQMRDFRNKTRMENLFSLIPIVKGGGFKKLGMYEEKEILIPPHFTDVQAMKRWMAAHSGVENFEEADCKNEHAATVKIKRGSVWLAESRIFDAVDSEGEMTRIVALNRQQMEKFF